MTNYDHRSHRVDTPDTEGGGSKGVQVDQQHVVSPTAEMDSAPLGSVRKNKYNSYEETQEAYGRQHKRARVDQPHDGHGQHGARSRTPEPSFHLPLEYHRLPNTDLTVSAWESLDATAKTNFASLAMPPYSYYPARTAGTAFSSFTSSANYAFMPTEGVPSMVKSPEVAQWRAEVALLSAGGNMSTLGSPTAGAGGGAAGEGMARAYPSPEANYAALDPQLESIQQVLAVCDTHHIKPCADSRGSVTSSEDGVGCTYGEGVGGGVGGVPQPAFVASSGDAVSGKGLYEVDGGDLYRGQQVGRGDADKDLVWFMGVEGAV